MSSLEERSLSSETVYDGVLLHVKRDEVRLPDGETSGREWIDHPGAAAAVPVDADGNVVLLRQYRFGPRREFWEVPAGKCDQPGEDPLDIAKRELAEEAGIEAQTWTLLGATYPAIGYSNEVIHLFLAEGLSRVEEHADDDEFVEPFRVPFAEAAAMARRGEIEDAKSCVALLLAAAVLEARDLD